jgi:hypothetical protein
MHVLMLAAAASGSCLVAARSISSSSSLPDPSKLGVVINRYKEDISPWEPFAKYTTVYAKFPFTDANDTVRHEEFRNYIDRPNCGREGESYLWHIVNRWEDLQDVMIFSQVKPPLSL